MDFVGGKIKGYVGPLELGASDELERVIVDFVGAATKTVDVAVQELDNEPATLFNDEALLVIGSTHTESEHVAVDRAECQRSPRSSPPKSTASPMTHNHGPTRPDQDHAER